MVIEIPKPSQGGDIGLIKPIVDIGFGPSETSWLS